MVSAFRRQLEAGHQGDGAVAPPGPPRPRAPATSGMPAHLRVRTTVREQDDRGRRLPQRPPMMHELAGVVTFGFVRPVNCRKEVRAVLSTIFSGGDDLIVILVAVVVLFGGKQLPKLAKNTGEALKEFRKAKTEAEAGGSARRRRPCPLRYPWRRHLPSCRRQRWAASQVTAAGPGASDSVTVSRSELDALLAERAARARAEGPKAES